MAYQLTYSDREFLLQTFDTLKSEWHGEDEQLLADACDWAKRLEPSCGFEHALARDIAALSRYLTSRVSGTQVEGASANIYRTVATLTPGGTYAIDEHGIFSAASNGTMMDRSVFADINVTAPDTIEFTYEGTFNAES